MREPISTDSYPLQPLRSRVGPQQRTFAATHTSTDTASSSDSGSDTAIASASDVGSARTTRRRRLPRREEQVLRSLSKGKSGDKPGKPILTKRQERITLLVVLVVLIALGGFVAWKFGRDVYHTVHDFVVFPTYTTPVDVTKEVVGIWDKATAGIGGVFHA